MSAPRSSRGRDPATLTLAVILAAGAAGALLASFFWRPEARPALSLCQFRAWTGLPCPGCGLTRGFCAIGHGDFGAAWRFNPFSFLFYAFTVLVLLWPLLRRAAPRAHARAVNSPWAFRVPVIVLVAMWLWGCRRIATELLGR